MVAVSEKNVLNRARKNGEIKNISDVFIQNVFLDILGRVSCLHETLPENCINSIISDIRTFYKLIRA